jgi:cytosine/adenosine deaminase-related metal-dependent hydrolase
VTPEASLATAGLTLRGGAVVSTRGARRADVHVRGRCFASTAAPDAVTIDVGGRWIYPGLINAHDHLHLNALPPLTGLGTFPNAYRWIDAAQARRAEPERAAAEKIPTGIRLWQGGLKNLLSGVTTVVHHDPWDPLFEHADFPVRVPVGYSWCHSLGLAGASSVSTLRYGPGVRESMADATPRWFIHLAEGTDAVAAQELAELDRLGALSERAVLVHATGLRPRDVDRVRERGAWVVWCPASNHALLGRTLDPHALIGDGRLALGTDSRLSGSIDLLAEMRLAARASGLAASALLRLVTEDAAQVIGACELGGIAPGRPADAVVIESDADDPYEALLSTTRGDIALVVKDGRPILAGERFRASVHAAASDVATVSVDGRVKYCPRGVLGPADASRLEPGLEVLS